MGSAPAGHLGDSHDVGNKAVNVDAAVADRLLVAVLAIPLQRLVQRLELQCVLLLDQLQPTPPSGTQTSPEVIV